MLFSLAVALFGVAVAVATGRDPLVTAPWIDGPRALRALWSLLAGLFVAVGALLVTKELVRRSDTGRALAAQLAPGFRTRATSALLLQGLAAGVSEELLFRGALTPLMGVVFSSVLFGLAHQMRGRGRILWSSFSAVVGLALGVVFAASGELLGAIVGHVTINVVNALYLRGFEAKSRDEERVSFAPLATHGDVRVQS